MEVEIETMLGLDWAERGDGRLLPNDVPQGGEDIADDLRVAPEGVQDSVTPPRDSLLALAEKLLDEGVKRFDDGGVWRVAVVLVVLPADVVALLARQRLQDLLDERRLADPRVPRNQDDGALPSKHVVESIDQLP